MYCNGIFSLVAAVALRIYAFKHRRVLLGVVRSTAAHLKVDLVVGCVHSPLKLERRGEGDAVLIGGGGNVWNWQVTSLERRKEISVEALAV